MTDLSHRQPSHDYRPLEKGAEKQTWVVVWLKGLGVVAEIVAGYWFNSMALLADGWHMASRRVAIGLSAIAYVLARRYAHDWRFAFGAWKIEVLAGFASAVLLVTMALLMTGESLMRFWSPAWIGFGEAPWVAVIGVWMKMLSAWLLSDQPHDHGHDHEHSSARRQEGPEPSCSFHPCVD